MKIACQSLVPAEADYESCPLIRLNTMIKCLLTNLAGKYVNTSIILKTLFRHTNENMNKLEF